MLHHVAEVEVGPSDLVEGHGEDGLDVLEGEAVPLDSLEGLGSADECLDVLGVDLQDGGAVLDDAVEVGDLLVARRPVGVRLQRQLR